MRSPGHLPCVCTHPREATLVQTPFRQVFIRTLALGALLAIASVDGLSGQSADTGSARVSTNLDARSEPVAARLLAINDFHGALEPPTGERRR